MNEMLKLENIVYGYNKKHITIHDLSFSVPKGSFHAFIGENGAGKSTTINMIVGLIDSYEGNIFINDNNVKHTNDARKYVSYIPDKAIFPNGFNTKKYLLNCGLLKRDDKHLLNQEIEEWAKSLEIEEILNKNPNKLSAGQKKKVFLIRAIIEKSQLIILDEPAANLDPTTRIQLFKTLKYLVDNGTTILISSHILDEIKNYTTSATFIKKGHFIWSGPVSGNQITDIYANYYLGENQNGFEKI